MSTKIWSSTYTDPDTGRTYYREHWTRDGAQRYAEQTLSTPICRGVFVLKRRDEIMLRIWRTTSGLHYETPEA